MGTAFLICQRKHGFLIQKILAGNRNSLADSVTADAIHMNIVEAAFSKRFKEDKGKEAVFQTGRLMGILYAASQKLICETNREKAENVAREYLYDVKTWMQFFYSSKKTGNCHMWSHALTNRARVLIWRSWKTMWKRWPCAGS